MPKEEEAIKEKQEELLAIVKEFLEKLNLSGKEFILEEPIFFEAITRDGKKVLGEIKISKG